MIDFFLEALGVDHYSPRKNLMMGAALFFQEDKLLAPKLGLECSGSVDYLVLLSNERQQPREAIRVMLKNILKYLQIPLESCRFGWLSSEHEYEADDVIEFSAWCSKLSPKFILSFGVHLDLELALRTLDLGQVLLQPILKRQVFEDVNRLLFSSTHSA